MEWVKDNRYNGFNSYKGLTYYSEYRSIVDWMSGKNARHTLPPIECSFDPIAECNLQCYYCNSQRYLIDNPDEVKEKVMSRRHMVKVIDFLARWGVRGICFGGGGESLLNKDSRDLVGYSAWLGMHSAIITNGTLMNETILKSLLQCNWVSFSVDAGTPKTFKRIKGVDLFQKVITNIKKLVDARDGQQHPFLNRIAYRVLLVPENVDDVLTACKLAKELGVDQFHVRPADLRRKDNKKARNLDVDYEYVNAIFNECLELETEDFKVQTVKHKFSYDFEVEHHFKRCLASPICLQACTDGNCYVCPDHRLEERFKLGSQKDILDWWGSKEHRELLTSIDPATECSRCTWSEYNRQIEEVVIENRMEISFP